MIWDCNRIREDLMGKLKPSRFWHTVGVADTAAALAMRYGADVRKAQLAGMLHDSARQFDNKTTLDFCLRMGIAVSEEEKACPILLHGKHGAYLAEHEYGVTDDEILQAITWHTTGRPGMSLLDKIIYMADYIEPSRTQQPRLAEIRHMAFVNLDAALIMTMEDTLKYLKETGSVIDQMSVRSLAYYKKESGM